MWSLGGQINFDLKNNHSSVERVALLPPPPPPHPIPAETPAHFRSSLITKLRIEAQMNLK